MKKISANIITRNEEKNILRCVDSVKPFADEIIIVDSMSEDKTAAICRSLGCTVLTRQFDDYGHQKQFCTDMSSNDWILSIDADEVVTPGLAEEILKWKNAGENDVCGYEIPFTLSFMGQMLQHSGVGGESHLRLFNRKKGKFTKVPIHERIEITGNIGKFKNRIIHYSYRDITHHLEKINRYTSQAATGYKTQGKKYSKIWAAFKFPVTFFIFYIIKGGILDGWPGFMWSFMASVYTVVKMAKTIELQTQ